MKLFVLLFVGILQLSEGKPSGEETTATGNADGGPSSTEIVIPVTLEPEDVAKTVSTTENVEKHSSEAEDHPAEVQLPVDLLSHDILLDPSVILARAERSVSSLESVEVPQRIRDSLKIDQFNDGIPTFYFVKFIRVPRSTSPRVVPDKNEHFRMPEESDKGLRRFSRSAKGEDAEDLHGADDGFIIRPLFKYRREQLKRSNNKGYRNRNSYSYYPRYPVFPGK